MMSTLLDRICGKGHPAAGVPATIAKDYGAPSQIPLTRITVYPNGIAYDEPLLTADGAGVTPTANGSWGQLYAAGR